MLKLLSLLLLLLAMGVVGGLHPSYPVLRETVRASSPELGAFLPEQSAVSALVAEAQKAAAQVATAVQAQVALLITHMQQPAAATGAASGDDEL